MASVYTRADQDVPNLSWYLSISFSILVIYSVIPLMVLDLVLRSLYLASLTIPLASSIFLTIYSALSLASYLSLLAALGP